VLKNSIVTSKLIASAVLSCLFVCVALLPLVLSSSDCPSHPWRGYFTLLVRERDEERLIHLLEARLEDGVIEPGGIVSMHTQMVSYTTFDGMAELPLSQVESRFDGMDPRLDPYMRALAGYFDASDGWTRVFIRSRTPLLHLYVALLASVPGHGFRWLLADIRPYGRILALCLSVAFLASLTLLRRPENGRPRGRRWILLLSSIPWLLAVLSGDFHDLLSFFLLFSAWYLVHEQTFDMVADHLFFGWSGPDRRDLRLPYLYMLTGLIAVTAVRVLSGRGGVDLLRGAAPLAASFLSTGPYALILCLRRWRTGHMVFTPVRIMRRERRGRTRKIPLAAACLVIAGAPLVFQAAAAGSGLHVPAPRAVKDLGSFTWGEMVRLWNRGDRGTPLPDLSDYVAHRIYQEGLPYGLGYGLPESGGPLTISHYVRQPSDGRIVRAVRVVKRFDDAWLAETLRVLPKASVERMVFDQGRPVEVVRERAGSRVPAYTPGKCWVLALFLVFVAFSFDFMARPVVIYRNQNPTKFAKRRAA